MPPTPSSVSATARGCSKISFCMKCRYGPSSTARRAVRHVDDRALDALSLRVVDRVALAPHVGDVAFVEIDDAPRHRQQRRRVGGEEMIVLADADDQRAARRAPTTRPGSRVEITAIA